MPPSTASRGVTAASSRLADADGAAVGGVHAGDDLDQRRLAGAVLAEERVHLAGEDVEVDVLEHADAGEGLRDAGERDEGGHLAAPAGRAAAALRGVPTVLLPVAGRSGPSAGLIRRVAVFRLASGQAATVFFGMARDSFAGAFAVGATCRPRSRATTSEALRPCHRRRRDRRLPARQPAERRSRAAGAAARGRGVGPPTTGSGFRWGISTASATRAPTGCTRPSRTRG